MSDELKKRELFEEFAAEHAKRARHLSAADERVLAWQLMAQMAETEWYRQLCTPAARMAHERELLKTLDAIGATDEAC
jgi:hypothetical protein